MMLPALLSHMNVYFGVFLALHTHQTEKIVSGCFVRWASCEDASNSAGYAAIYMRHPKRQSSGHITQCREDLVQAVEQGVCHRWC